MTQEIESPDLPGRFNHGPSRVLLVPIDGRIRLGHGEDEHDLAPGAAAHIGLGERLSLANPGPTPATALVVASPPQFADTSAAFRRH
jgi:mannose-6-phosphate isomerase-like protein (cupin superfamily)